MPDRFIFRQVYAGDLGVFLADGEIRSKNHPAGQRCHQTSYPEIVDRRGTQQFQMPCGGVVNDYVPFYFSPRTAFAYAIHMEDKVRLRSPDGADLGVAKDADRIFLVSRIADMAKSGLEFCFSDYALNSSAPMPTVETDLSLLESHVHWDVFDEAPLRSQIPEIGYAGVCQYFHNVATSSARQLRRQKRMAEFLVRHCVPLDHVCCIVTKSEDVRARLQCEMDASGWAIPIYAKPGCFF